MKKNSQLRLAALGALLIPLLWIAALIGTSYPRFHALLVSVNGLTLADYGAEALNLSIAPLTSQVYRDAYRDALAAPVSGNYTWYTVSHGNLQANASPLPSATSAKPSASSTPNPSGTPTARPTPTPFTSASSTPMPSGTGTPAPTASATPAPTPTPTATPAPSATVTSGTYVVPAGQTYNGDLVVDSQSVIINGTVTGDVKVTSGDVQIGTKGYVGGDVVVTSGNVTVNGWANKDVKVQSGNLVLDSKAHVVADVVVTSGTLTRRPGSYVGGSVTVN
jgi:cytoskeletal protein CcmA (bactofilin family)